MPIPKRSASLREPRKPSSNIARPTNDTTTPAAGSSQAPTRPTNDRARSSDDPSPAEGLSLKDNTGTSRGRTLLPQRSNLARDDGNGSAQVRFQPSETRLPHRGGTSPKRLPPVKMREERQRAPSTSLPSSTVPARRQSLIRPSALKTTSTRSNVPASSKATTPTFRPPSPRKASTFRSPTQSSAAARPPSPKKTEMLPPPRPMRSASLRQPREAPSGPPAPIRGHARHRSQMVPASTKPSQPDPSPTAQKPRAPFSTYQQHYSPRKPTKPPTPTPGATSGIDNLIPTSWPDIAALQTELLQLSLFHSSSLQQHAEWKSDSESRLRKKYDAVADQYRSTLACEQSHQHQLNMQSLSGWLQNCREHQGPHGFSEQIQIFSQVLQEISDLGITGLSGRYIRAVAFFEDWFQQVGYIRHQRESTGTFDGSIFIDPLDTTWKEETTALHAKLELCARQIQSLDILGFGAVEQLPQSALTRVAQGLVESIQLMLQEIRAMRSLEAEIVRLERECVRRLATELAGSGRAMSAPRSRLQFWRFPSWSVVIMKDSLYDRLWRRECGDWSPYASLRGIYGSKEWIDDLDIVNELGGHTGCVNALSWSKSGRLLASGSDDQHLNIYSYQPDSSDAQFSLNTTIATGHKANIFSVKFMPHSNDRTLVTCAGDSQVRVFDIEYSSANSNIASTSAFAASARSRRFNNFFEGTRYLNEGNTNARVYRSHADRVKRIVTESSPHLFLTCSEDGEVRQWDLRQPSEAYPPPRGGQGFMAYRPGLEHDDSNVPPPLISYKKFRLDLNTISCSPSQPHYIALGGAHMHCFLHDRRMLGRDPLAERGSPGVSSSSAASFDDELMSKATRCVRRFAPRGKRRLKHLDDGHITACKISDANPDEMVVSWSGDHIYSFDLIRSPDARDVSPELPSASKKAYRRKTDTQGRKRKRRKPASMSSQESGDRHQPHLRSEEPGAFRITYENGESENVLFPTGPDEDELGMVQRARYSVLNEAQRLSMRIAKGLVKLRQALFSLEATAREATEAERSGPTLYSGSFASALSLASLWLPQMDQVMREWHYPLNPSSDTVTFQQSLRQNRQASWRFVQAAGTLARALSDDASVEAASSAVSDFLQIVPAPNEDDSIDPGSQFGYDFLKAILLWIQGGRQEVLKGFKRGNHSRRVEGRFPIPDEATEDAIDTILIPYLQGLAKEIPVVNVDASRFEHDSTRVLFPTQVAAVTAFGNAVRLPLEDLGTTAARVDHRRVSNPSSHVRSLDRASATRFWVLRVGRGILMEAGSGVNYSFVNRAFGGIHTAIDESASDEDLERVQDDIDPTAEEEHLQPMSRLGTARSGPIPRPEGAAATLDYPESEASEADGSDESEGGGANSDEDEEETDGWPIGLEDSSEDEGDGESWDEDGEEPLFIRGTTRKSRRGEVESNTPISAHTRVYRGHCNIKTVKDVNFFGLNDEYVVSGSDSGHLFIWDRKTANLVNILEGDSEVVNVVQGHPYEPTIAVSGIDNTIKIFSPDRHAQDLARRGINILDPDNPANLTGSAVRNLGGLESRKRIHDSYRIMSQNDVDRRGGMSEAYITRSMLARLAATLRGGQVGTGGLAAGLAPGEGATVVLDDNCLVCSSSRSMKNLIDG
ncbi:WD repeat protein iqw1 [Penicillium rolfsii]|nr:WD repeat protein iqw1 [Penicillium rolfsii]